MKRNNKNGFTLVELLAVIVILAIILVIAVPKVMSVIEDSKKATLESTAKMIASSTEKQKVQNTVLGNTNAITCDSVAKINKGDYASCNIEFENNTAKVTIEGSGKFEGLWVCGGTKTNAVASDELCLDETAVSYIEDLLKQEETLYNGLVQATASYINVNNEEVTIDAGIRYIGNTVHNNVYYNCDDIDSKGVVYGAENYNYENSCEVWKIIGIFDVDNGNGKIEKKIILLNFNSNFSSSWDSSEGIITYEEDGYTIKECTGIECGYGVNQWGSSGDYEGADLMRLLNGFYISKENETCVYCDNKNQGICTNTCTADSFKMRNMKVLTTTAKNMIENAVWDTYASNFFPILTSDNPSVGGKSYLAEKGITTQYTGSSECSICSSEIIRTTSWTGLVGLMSTSDVSYGNSWMSGVADTWLITTLSDGTVAHYQMSPVGYSVQCMIPSYSNGGDHWAKVNPVVYLKHNVKIIDGNGDTKPYILAM